MYLPYLALSVFHNLLELPKTQCLQHCSSRTNSCLILKHECSVMITLCILVFINNNDFRHCIHPVEYTSYEMQSNISDLANLAFTVFVNANHMRSECMQILLRWTSFGVNMTLCFSARFVERIQARWFL